MFYKRGSFPGLPPITELPSCLELDKPGTSQCAISKGKPEHLIHRLLRLFPRSWRASPWPAGDSLSNRNPEHITKRRFFNHLRGYRRYFFRFRYIDSPQRRAIFFTKHATKKQGQKNNPRCDFRPPWGDTTDKGINDTASKRYQHHSQQQSEKTLYTSA